jgi:hypothetical protein
MGFFGKNTDVSGRVFDWDAYYDDIARGISVKAQTKKFKRFAYYTSEAAIKAKKNSHA